MNNMDRSARRISCSWTCAVLTSDSLNSQECPKHPGRSVDCWTNQVGVRVNVGSFKLWKENENEENTVEILLQANKEIDLDVLN